MGKSFKIKCWGDLTLSDYERVEEIIKDESLSDAEKDVALISLLIDEPEENIWDKSTEEVMQLRAELSSIKPASEGSQPKFSKIKVGDYECNLMKSIDKMTYAQYVDYQTYMRNIDTSRAEFLSVLLIPNGKKYNEDYDLGDLQKQIKENVSLSAFGDVCFFFLNSLASSTSVLAKSLVWTMRVKMMRMRKSPMKEKLKEIVKEIQCMDGFISSRMSAI